MANDPIAPELGAEMARVREAGRVDVRLPVIVAVDPPPQAAQARDVDALGAAVRAAQEPVVQRLAALGVKDVRKQQLASALEVHLTPDQIDAVAAEPSVRALMLNRTVQVTTSEEGR